jgi:hypothetical protein
MKACMSLQGDRIHLRTFYIKDLMETYWKLRSL